MGPKYLKYTKYHALLNHRDSAVDFVAALAGN